LFHVGTIGFWKAATTSLGLGTIVEHHSACLHRHSNQPRFKIFGMAFR
jgi:hypothetical protein